MNRLWSWLVCFAVLLFGNGFGVLFSGAFATPPTQADLTGLAIMETISARQYHPFEFEQLTITRTNADGSRVIRKGRRYTRLQQGEGSTNRYVLVFDSPKPIRGVAFLIRRIDGGVQGHWVYLPALGPWMHRVAGGGGEGVFDTDFSVEDLINEDFQQFIYQRKPDLMYKKQPHFLIEAHPVKRENRWPSNYGFRRIYVDREHYRISRIDYYDRSGTHLKSRTNQGSNSAKQIWRPDTVHMENHQEGTRTTIKTLRRFFTDKWVPETLFSRHKIVKGALLETKYQPGH
jgi:hypothetical protein